MVGEGYQNKIRKGVNLDTGHVQDPSKQPIGAPKFRREGQDEWGNIDMEMYATDLFTLKAKFGNGQSALAMLSIKGDISQTDSSYACKNIHIHTVKKDTIMVVVT